MEIEMKRKEIERYQKLRHLFKILFWSSFFGASIILLLSIEIHFSMYDSLIPQTTLDFKMSIILITIFIVFGVIFLIPYMYLNKKLKQDIIIKKV